MNRDEAMTCFWGGVIAAVIVLGATLAYAADPPRLPAGVTCSDVRANVERYGERIALTWARLNGYSRAEIEQAKRCLR